MILLHARYNTPTAAVSSNVATKEPSTFWFAPYTCLSAAADNEDDGLRTHLTYHLVEEIEVELAEDEEDEGDGEEPHRPGCD